MVLRGWRVGWALAALVAVGGLALVLAAPVGINRVVPFPAVLSLRNGLTVLGCVGSVVAASAVPWRWTRPVALPVGLAVLALTLTSGAVAISRGFADPAPAIATAGQLRILSWNTNDGLVDPPAIAALAARMRATIVVLPDAGIAEEASLYARAFQAADYPMRLQAAPGPSTQLAVYIAAPYSTYYRRAKPGPDTDKTLRITPTSSNLPTILALHAPQPTRHGTAPWNTDLAWVADQCGSGEVIAVGDFNATVDSFGSTTLGHCSDIATAHRAGSVGTWPTAVPPWLGMPIDHVLATPGWHARSFTVITDEDDSGALHRPIFSVLTR
jgi:endonuclease/exonuclease/phosphatase (EEP) superfamily protein YafD